jgi:hypothetical protein
MGARRDPRPIPTDVRGHGVTIDEASMKCSETFESSDFWVRSISCWMGRVPSRRDGIHGAHGTGLFEAGDSIGPGHGFSMTSATLLCEVLTGQRTP